MTSTTTPPSGDTVRQLRVVVEVTDYDAALHFFRDVLGMPEQAAFAEGTNGDDRVAVLAAGIATVEIATPAHAAYIDRVEGMGEDRGPVVRLAFEVPDASASTRMAIEAGAVVIAPPTRTPWQSLNSRLGAPGDLQITLFEELTT